VLHNSSIQEMTHSSVGKIRLPSTLLQFKWQIHKLVRLTTVSRYVIDLQDFLLQHNVCCSALLSSILISSDPL